MGAFCSTLRPGAVRDYDPLPRRNTPGVLAVKDPTPRRAGDRTSPSRTPAQRQPSPADNHREATAPSSGQQTGRIGPWHRGGLLGSGGFGRVYLASAAHGAEGHQLFAVKQVALSREAALQGKVDHRVKEMEGEVAVLWRLSHPNIVRYYGTERTDEHLNIFLEYVAGGTMANIAAGFGGIREPVLARYTRQLLEGLAYLHSKEVMHRDIKGANILVSQNNTVKLADFGAAKDKLGQVTIGSGLTSLKGTPYWMAPEVVRGEKYGRKADIWSVGATVVEMLTGKHPWPATEHHFATFTQIATAKGGPPVPTTVSRELRDFLNLCFARDPRDRADAQRLLGHPFVAEDRLQPQLGPITVATDPLGPAFAGSDAVATTTRMSGHSQILAGKARLMQQVAQHAPPSPIREEKEEEDAWLIGSHPPSPRSSQVPSTIPPALPQASAPESMSSSGEQGNPMQEPSGIFNPLPADNEDEAESRMQRALVSYMPEPQQQQQHHHQHHQQHQQLQQRRGSSSPDPPAGPSKGRSVVELSQDILHYVQSKGRQNHLRASAGFEGGLDFQPLGASSARLSSATGSKIRLAAQPSPTKSSRSKALPAQAPPAGSQRDRSGPANAADATAEPAAAGLTQEQVWEQELWQEIALKRAAAR